MTGPAIYLMDMVGVAVFAISGVLTAGRRQLDLLGVLVVATAAAIGGGTLRDLLLDRHPVFWIADPLYLWVIAATAAGTIVYLRFASLPQRALLVADALGLALFAISGAQIAMQSGAGGVVAVLLGTMSGTAGGVLRDLLAGEAPMLLRDRAIYATAAIAGIVVYLLVLRAWPSGAAFVGMALVVAIRLAAVIWRLRIPAFRVGEPRG